MRTRNRAGGQRKQSWTHPVRVHASRPDPSSARYLALRTGGCRGTSICINRSFWPLALAVTVPRVGKHDQCVEGLRLMTVRRGHDSGGGEEAAARKIEFTVIKLVGG